MVNFYSAVGFRFALSYTVIVNIFKQVKLNEHHCSMKFTQNIRAVLKVSCLLDNGGFSVNLSSVIKYTESLHRKGYKLFFKPLYCLNLMPLLKKDKIDAVTLFLLNVFFYYLHFALTVVLIFH